MVNTNQVKNAKLILSSCLALTIRKEGTVRNYSGEFWMYENGYLLFQVSNFYFKILSVQIERNFEEFFKMCKLCKSCYRKAVDFR